MLFVVVESTIAVDATYAKELLHHLQTPNALSALGYHKLMSHLEAGFVTPASCSRGLPHDVDRKASFAVDETSHPTDVNQSFLLIVRS
jgi:hypothetical protein